MGSSRPKRRTFTASYKARVLAEYDALPDGSPERGALMRRERLCHSHIEHWRSNGYDADGNQTSAGGLTYSYNGADELSGADTLAGDFAYSYDAGGNLATTSLNGTQIQRTVLDLNNPLPEVAETTASSGAVSSDNTWNPNGSLNSETEKSATGAGTTFYAVTDWDSSVTGLVNGSGTQVADTDYSPYGTASTTGTVSSDIGYAGSYTLIGCGLDDMRARDYSSDSDGFTSVDPLAVLTSEPYSYVAGNPVGATDPSGLCGFWCWTGIGAAVVGTTACIIVEPCGIVEGGLAVSGGGAIAAAGGVTLAGGETIAGVRSLAGLLVVGRTRSARARSSDNSEEECD